MGDHVDLQGAARAWTDNLRKLAEHIRNGYASDFSSYTRKEGWESDHIVYGYKVNYNGFRFHIECDYVCGGSKRFRRLVVKSGLSTVARLDIHDMIYLGLHSQSDAIKELSEEGKKIHDLISQIFKNREAEKVYGSALRDAQKLAGHL